MAEQALRDQLRNIKIHVDNRQSFGTIVTVEGVSVEPRMIPGQRGVALPSNVFLRGTENRDRRLANVVATILEIALDVAKTDVRVGWLHEKIALPTDSRSNLSPKMFTIDGNYLASTLPTGFFDDDAIPQTTFRDSVPGLGDAPENRTTRWGAGRRGPETVERPDRRAGPTR